MEHTPGRLDLTREDKEKGTFVGVYRSKFSTFCYLISFRSNDVGYEGGGGCRGWK